MARGEVRPSSIRVSDEFEAHAKNAQFRDVIAIRVTESPEAIFRALQEVTLAEMPLARVLGQLRYLPSRLGGHPPVDDRHKPFLSIFEEGGTLVLHATPSEIITGSAGRLHSVFDQAQVHFGDRSEFEAFSSPDYEKLFMSVRVQPTGTAGEHWLILEHATLALSRAAERKFRRYWRVIKPAGAFVSRLLLKAIRRRARSNERLFCEDDGRRRRSVRASRQERTRCLFGDEMIPEPLLTLTHAITIGCPRSRVWPWLVQMGAGTRAGWYSYDALDNGGRPSARHIVPELQHLSTGLIFPAVPGATDAFSLLACVPARAMVLGWAPPDGRPVVTWAFILEDVGPGVVRLIARARGGRGYTFHGLPWWLARRIVPVVHFVMQRKQLVGIAERAEGQPPPPYAHDDGPSSRRAA